MRDLSAVRGYLPEIQSNDIDVLLLNIHQSPGADLLTWFEFVFSPTYLIYDGNGEEVFRSNDLPSQDEIIQLAGA